MRTAREWSIDIVLEIFSKTDVATRLELAQAIEPLVDAAMRESAQSVIKNSYSSLNTAAVESKPLDDYDRHFDGLGV